MFNLLKIRNKKYYISLLAIMNVVVLANDSNAQKKARKTSSASTRLTKASRVNSSANTPITDTDKPKSTDNSSGKEIDVSTITKYNCENLYNQCMNKTCYNASNGRCNCSQQAKFDEANKLCEYITNACPSQASDIVKTFARNASNDCMSVALTNNKGNFKNIHNYVADTLACLKPKCKQSKTEEFVGCFDDDNLKNRLEICKSNFSEVSDLDEFYKLIQESFLTYKQKYCNAIFGTLKEDGNCYLTIGIGVSSGDIKKKKEFKTGDKVVCSSKWFNTSMGDDTVQQIKLIKNITLASVSIMQQGLSMASSIASSSSSTGKKSASANAGTALTAVSGVLEMASTALPIVQDSYTLATTDFSYTGKCYVISNGTPHEMFTEDDTIAYKLRWADNWSDTIYEN